MKIGILTYHRSHNYGALLQAIALRKVLVDMGHEVTFIDYWPDYHWHTYAFFSLAAMLRENLLNSMRYAKNCIVHGKSRRDRIKHFEEFIAEYITPCTSSMDEEYDVIIHGSDQIWRKQPEWNTYNPIYFGNHKIKTKFKISYAASMGCLPDTEVERNMVKDYLKCLNHIGVRELDLRNMVNEFGFNCSLDADPTLLLSGIDWSNLFNLKKYGKEKYVLYYFLLPDTFKLHEVEQFAQKHGLELKILYGHATERNSHKKITTANPSEFLDLLYNAEYVITSSFHGLVFSILFHKQFFASFNINPGRAESILEVLQIQDRLIPPNSVIPSNVENIDYERVEGTLCKYRKTSLDNLNEIIVKRK